LLKAIERSVFSHRANQLKLENDMNSKRHTAYAFSLPAILLLFLCFSYVPQYAELTELKKQDKRFKRDLNNARKRNDELLKIKGYVRLAKEDSLIADKALPDKKEILPLLTSLFHASQTAGLEFLEYRVGSEKIKNDGAFYREVPVFIKLAGNYHHMLRFLDEVSKIFRVVAIKDIQITVSDTDESRLILSCTAVAYLFAETPPSPYRNFKVRKTDSKKRTKKWRDVYRYFVAILWIAGAVLCAVYLIRVIFDILR
jgi:type IV pilus assembly protein PilO